MASFSYGVRMKRANKRGLYPVRIRVYHNYTECELTTKWEVAPKDLRRGEIKNVKILDSINALLIEWREKVARMNQSTLDRVNARELLDMLLHGEDSTPETWSLDFVQYVRYNANKMIAEGREGTGKLRLSAINSLCAYIGKESLEVSALTSRVVAGWVDWIESTPARNGKTKGNRGAALYITQLKAEFNRAKLEFNDEDLGVIRIPHNPFKKIKITEALPEQRSITLEQLRAFVNLSTEGKGVRYTLAHDVFLLSFYLMGMNSVDLFNCPQQKDGERIDYERTKTRTRRKDRAKISVLIPDVARPLVEKYRGKRSCYFKFNSMYSTPGTFSRALGLGLKEIGEELGIKNLQFYAARHTWATIAYNDAGVDKGAVSDALNHVDPHMSVTDRYIRKDWQRIDDANRKVLAVVFGD